MSTPPTVAIAGVTGFIGSGLPALFSWEGWRVVGISRQLRQNTPLIPVWQTLDGLDLAGVDAVVNLSGHSIDRRWTNANRARFHESRIGTSERILAALANLPEDQRPRTWINASAVGIYGDRGDEVLDESAAPGGGYLAELCAEWERSALGARKLGVRVVLPRIGIVLGREGAAFRKLAAVFRAGIGGRLGSGHQWMPWIHVEDVRSAIVHAALHPSLEGPFNASAPHPETNREFTRKLARALHRPALLPAPAFALRLVLGEFGTALLAGQRAKPGVLEQSGYRFHFPRLEDALSELL